MIAWPLFLPAVVAVVVGVATGRLQRRLHPAVASMAFAAVAGLAAIAVAGAVVVLAALFLVQVPWVSDHLGWCEVLGADHTLPAWLGAGLVVGTLAMAWSLRGSRRSKQRLPIGAGELVVVPSDDANAFAVPGRPGHIVVTSGMLRRLDEHERLVLLAHERAHLHLGHHRYLFVAEVAARLVPILRPLRDRVRFATERLADESAAAAVGDRRLVARAICRAALPDVAVGRAMAMAELGVPARVEAMLAAVEPRSSRLVVTASAAGALGVVALSSAWQLHHVAAFAAHVCNLR